MSTVINIRERERERVQRYVLSSFIHPVFEFCQNSGMAIFESDGQKYCWLNLHPKSKEFFLENKIPQIG